MKKYNYYFTCVESDGATPKTYELLNSTVRFSYIRSVAYTSSQSLKMSCLFLESMELDNDKSIKDLYKFFTTISGGQFTCEQYSESGEKVFEINSEILGADLSINNGVSTTDENQRGFSFSLKLNFKEEV